MPSYSYKNSCYSSPLDLYTAIAQDCTQINGSQITQCSPTLTGIDVSNTIDNVTTVISYQPLLIDCVIDSESILEYNGLLLLLVVSAWAITMIKRVIK
jgi:hypothetical protein